MSKIKKAGPQIVATRLNEEWEEESDEETNQEMMFEKRLWALNAYEWLTQGKQLQSPMHEHLSASLTHEGVRVLHVHGPIGICKRRATRRLSADCIVADGWVLAARYPGVTVFTISSQNANNGMAGPAPTNHHSLYLPSPSSTMPFPDCYFDAIISRSLPSMLRKKDLNKTFSECMRCLKPGARIEFHTLDPYLASQGPATKSWIDEQLIAELRAGGKCRSPSTATIDAMSNAGLQNIKQARVALPAVASGSSNEAKLLTNLGHYLYQDLYCNLVRFQGEGWFWDSRQVAEECKALQTQMVITIACSQKPERS
jgi:SAM-dependent methyltransferase